MKIWKKTIGLVLSLVLLVSVFPVSALAANEDCLASLSNLSMLLICCAMTSPRVYGDT